MSGALNFTLADVTKFVLHTYIHYREFQLDNIGSHGLYKSGLNIANLTSNWGPGFG